MLFLCTGNYYQFRHAGAVFDHHAARGQLGWRAASRGLALERGVHNVGPIEKATPDRLAALGIRADPYLRMPASVVPEDLAAAGLIVAMQADEHRPLVCERYPDWVGKVEYWDVHDVGLATPDVALPLIEARVLGLVARLTDGGGEFGRAGGVASGPERNAPRGHTS